MVVANDNYPQFCYAVYPGSSQIVLIRRYERGFWLATGMTREAADEKNAKMGVTHAIRESMMVGSMFGWGVPGARPENCQYAKSLVAAESSFNPLA